MTDQAWFAIITPSKRRTHGDTEMINMNIFTKADHENMQALADLFATAEMAEMFMTENEFRDGISNSIETNFGDARITGAMFASVARKFFQSFRDARHAKGAFRSAMESAEEINAYIERNSTNC